MRKLLVFDMDGTIADLYGVPNWLTSLESFDSTPYRVASPMYDMELLGMYLEGLKMLGYEVAVTTWLSMNTTKEYSEEVAKVKKEWLDGYQFPYDYFYAVPYGTPKHTVTSAEKHIIFDDNEKVRSEWQGTAIDATKSIIPILEQLLDEI